MGQDQPDDGWDPVQQVNLDMDLWTIIELKDLKKRVLVSQLGGGEINQQ